MLLRILLVFTILTSLVASASGQDISNLLAAAAVQPGISASELTVAESNQLQKTATSALFPKVIAFASGENYNSPTNLRPLPPTEVNIKTGESIPFSRNILRYGLKFSMPVYVKSIYDLSKKRALLTERARLLHTENLVKREAAVVSLNSAYQYLVRLDEAVASRIKSLEKTREDVALKVKNGRAAGAELMKVDTSINDLNIQKNDLAAKIIEVRRGLEKFTNLDVAAPVPMVMVVHLSPAPYLGVTIAEKSLDVAKKEVDRRRAERYPALRLKGFISGNEANAYNSDDHIFRSYNNVSLVLTLPLFDRTLKKEEKVSRIEFEKSKKSLEDIRIELAALEKSLKRELPVIKRSIELANRSISEKKELLNIARVAYDSGRIITEEYLRYESGVLAAQAALFGAENEHWQIISKLAVLYGTEMKGVVR